MSHQDLSSVYFLQYCNNINKQFYGLVVHHSHSCSRLDVGWNNLSTELYFSGTSIGLVFCALDEGTYSKYTLSDMEPENASFKSNVTKQPSCYAQISDLAPWFRFFQETLWICDLHNIMNSSNYLWTKRSSKQCVDSELSLLLNQLMKPKDSSVVFFSFPNPFWKKNICNICILSQTWEENICIESQKWREWFVRIFLQFGEWAGVKMQKTLNLKAPPTRSVNKSVSSNDFELNTKVTGSHNVDSEISLETFWPAAKHKVGEK